MNPTISQSQGLKMFLRRYRIRRGLAFGVIIIAALLAFEIFNYSTTDYALSDLLGNLKFLGIRWSTILAIAFCGIDFAGIARLFTPAEASHETGEVWYLFGAWLLAATMNAILTWWGVSLAVLNHQTLGNALIERNTLLRVVPIFVAVLVWLIRVLIIGTFSVAGDRLFSQADQRSYQQPRQFPASFPAAVPVRSLSNHSSLPRATAPTASMRPSPKPVSQPEASGFARPEPTYHSLSMSGSQAPSNNNSSNPFSSKATPQIRR